MAPGLRQTAHSLLHRCGIDVVRYSGFPLSQPSPGEYSTLINPVEVDVQRETYFIALNDVLGEGDRVLDVGCGLGYGLTILAIKAGGVVGVDVDQRAVTYCRSTLLGRNPRLEAIEASEPTSLPFEDGSFDVVTSVDVIEHVDDYDGFLFELLRVSRRAVVIGTPNRRPENTRADGRPANYWHLREWTHGELDQIVRRHASVSWHFVNGVATFVASRALEDDTQALVPVLEKA